MNDDGKLLYEKKKLNYYSHGTFNFRMCCIVILQWYERVEEVKEETELYNMIMNEEFQELEIKEKGNCPQAVQIMILADNQLVILTMDGVYYLLEKIQ